VESRLFVPWELDPSKWVSQARSLARVTALPASVWLPELVPPAFVATLPATRLSGDRTLTLILFFVRNLCLPQLTHFLPQPLLCLVHPSVALGLVLARVGLDLTPI
jgi:hypothetical protein